MPQSWRDQPGSAGGGWLSHGAARRQTKSCRGELYEDERGRSRKREQKVWLGSKQVYHLDDDQHQQNQSRIQALLLSISPFDYEDYDEPSQPSTKHDTFPKDINIIKNANKNKKVFYQVGFFFG